MIFDGNEDQDSTFHRSAGMQSRHTMVSGKESIVSLLEDCSTTCSTKSGNDLTSGKNYENAIPSCCRGGVSALKMIYHGPDGSFLVPSDPSLGSFVQLDPCNDQRRRVTVHQNSLHSVRFANCDLCFPPTNTGCDVPCNTTTSLEVASGNTICMVLVNEDTDEVITEDTFPTSTDLFFVAPEDDDTVKVTTIDTSCSKPIYAPYGVHVGTCNDDDDAFYVDVSLSSGAEDKAILEFVDGISAKHPSTLFSDCPCDKVLPPSHLVDSCCRGGVSFIKARLMGATVGGFLTVNPFMVESSSDCDGDGVGGYHHRTGNKFQDNESSSSSDDHDSINSSPVRFVNCDDACLHSPSKMACQSYFDGIDIRQGDDFCIVSDSFPNKMPTNVALWLMPEDDAAVLSLRIHTSCSYPFLGYGQAFAHGCDGTESSFVDLFDEDQLDDSEIYIAFLDGFSAGYFTAVQEFDDSSLLFDFSFSGCGCQCDSNENTFFPSSDDSVAPSTSQYGRSTNAPSNSASLTPSVYPTVAPTKLTSVLPSQSLSPTAPRPLGPKMPSAPPNAIAPNAPSNHEFVAPSSNPSSFRGRMPSSPPQDLLEPTTSRPIDLQIPSAADGNTLPSQDLPTGASEGLLSTFPSQSLAPTALRPLGPKIDQTSSFLPSNHPTFAVSENPTFDKYCASQCEAWVFDNCVLVGDDGTPLGVGCDVAFSNDLDEGRFLGVSKADEISYHREMIAKVLLLIG